MNKRDFLKKAGLATAGGGGATTLAAPYVKAQSADHAGGCRPMPARRSPST